MKITRLFMAMTGVLTAAVLVRCAEDTGGVKTGNGATISIQAVSPAGAGAPIVAASAASRAVTRSGEEEDDDGPEGEDGSGAILTVTEGYANVEFVQIDLPDGADCDSFGGFGFLPPVSCEGGEITVEGPFLVDLILGATIPESGELTIPPGTYKKVKIRFGESDGLNLPDGHPLEGHTLYAAGTILLSDGVTSYSYVMPFDFDVDPEFENPAGIDVSGAALDRILLNLDVTGWFTDLPIGDCIEELGTIVEPIDFAADLEGDCEDVEDELKDNIEQSGDLGHEEAEDDD